MRFLGGEPAGTTQPSPLRWTKLSKDAVSGENLMPASLDCARAGVTTGEWADALRAVFGEYRAPTGVSSQTALLATPRPVKQFGLPLRRRLPSSEVG